MTLTAAPGRYIRELDLATMWTFLISNAIPRMSRVKISAHIPGTKEWAGYDSDLDVRDAHKLLFGKTNDEIQHLFGGVKSISRADELLFMPRGAFQYYVLGFAQYVMSDQAIEDPDSASPFLRLLLAREKRDPGSVLQIYSHLAPAIEFVATHQKYFDADPNIYGSFSELAGQLYELYNAYDATKSH